MQGLPHLYTEDDFGFSFRGLKSELSETTELHVILLIIPPTPRLKAFLRQTVCSTILKRGIGDCLCC